MSQASVELSFRKQTDALALLVENIQSAVLASSIWSSVDATHGLWALADASADAGFENAVKGATLTAVDTAIANMTIGNSAGLTSWFGLISNYATAVEALSGSNGLISLLRSRGFRAPMAFAVSMFEPRYSRKMDVGTSALHRDCVGAKGIFDATEQDHCLAFAIPIVAAVGSAGIAANATARLHKLGSVAGGTGTVFTWTASAGSLDSTRTIGSPILVNNAADSTIDSTLTCTRHDGTTQTFNVKYAAPGANKSALVGCVAVNSACGVGVAGYTDKIRLNTGLNAKFASSDWVLITEGVGDALKQEVCLLTSAATVDMVCSQALKHTYSNSAFVVPIYLNATTTAKASGAGGYDVYACPDRVLV
jgi:hypothetical protein